MVNTIVNINSPKQNSYGAKALIFYTCIIKINELINILTFLLNDYMS